MVHTVLWRVARASKNTKKACKALPFASPQTPVPGRPWSITAPGRVASPSHQSRRKSCAAPARVATAIDIARDDDGSGVPTRASTARRAGRVGWPCGPVCVDACVCVLSGKGSYVPARTRVVVACVRSGGDNNACLYPTRLPYMTTKAERRLKSPWQTRGGKLSTQRQSPRPRRDCS